MKQHEFQKYQERLNEEGAKFEPVKEDKKEEIESDDENKFDNEEEGGEWVTTDNLYSHIGGAGGNLLENKDNLLFTNIKDGEGRTLEEEAQEEKATTEEVK